MAISKNIYILFSLVVLAVSSALLAGCAGIDPFDAPKEIMKNPLGSSPLRIGMSKDQVKSIWGEPDQINALEPADEWQTPRAEWVYLGRYTKIPLDKSYLFKSKYLIFDGDNLVCVGDESQCKATGLTDPAKE